MIGLLVGLVSCSGAKNSHNAAEDNADGQEVFEVNIRGQWDIENVVENDSSYVRPSEIGEGTSAYIDFKEDNTFGVITNCNHLGGSYVLSNDSIRIQELFSTEMACDNMEVEEMLKKILPIVNSIDCINDSITRLNSDKGESYIVLKKRILTLK